MKDKTGAVQRRLVIVPFDAKFTPNDPDFRPFIKDELCEQDSMEYLDLLGLKGLRRVLMNAQFTTKPFPTLNFHGKSPNAVGSSLLINGSAVLVNAGCL